jgi:hypothetical protein
MTQKVTLSPAVPGGEWAAPGPLAEPDRRVRAAAGYGVEPPGEMTTGRRPSR